MIYVPAMIITNTAMLSNIPQKGMFSVPMMCFKERYTTRIEKKSLVTAMRFL